MRTKDVMVLGLASLLAAALVWRAFDPAPKRAAAGAIASEQRSSDGSTSEARASEERLNGLHGEVVALRQQLAAQQLAAQQLAAVSGQAPVAPPPVEQAAPDRAADQRRLEEHLQGVVADFEAEPRDVNWARDRTEEFHRSFARGRLLEQAVQSVDCRSSMCRVEMLDNRSPDFFKELNDMVSTIGPHLPSMSGQRLTRPDGTAVAVYFFSKDS